jgi:hypothetical protein
MRVYVTQIYIEVGIEYPFSHRFQKRLGEELSKRVCASPQFLCKYGDDYDLTLNVSAKAALSEPLVKGPTVFRGDKDVEYTIFLPFVRCRADDQRSYIPVFRHILDCAAAILDSLEIDVSKIVRDAESIVRVLCTTGGMIDRN